MLPLIAALLLTLFPVVHQDGESGPAKGGELVRGITVSTHGMGRDWGSDAMLPTLEEIRSLGAGWVCIHPYARIREDGSLRHWEELDVERPPEHWVRPIREAHARGLKILIKPHLAYWGSPFRWRGDIDFDLPDQRVRFWKDYTHWIEQLAAMCRDADGFVVGTELDRLLEHEEEWRRLIAAVRQRTDAALTYAANWTHYEQVAFWDALDVIGIQAYFPLAEKPSTDEEELRAAWRKWMKDIRRFADAKNRNVVFTELGYNRAFHAPVQPWDDRSDGPEAWPIAALCYRLAFEAIDSEPRVLGAFLWKWFPGRRPNGRNFQLAAPEIRSVIESAWKRRQD